MQIILDNTEIHKLIMNILCDGLYHMGGNGFELQFDNVDYDRARTRYIQTKGDSPCIEDVQMQMLIDGTSLTFVDVEGDGDHTTQLTMQRVKDNVHHIPSILLTSILEGDYDAGDADAALQYILFTEIIFG